MKKLLAALFYLGFVAQASATISCSLPFTLTNGTTADATQVMANYNALVTCFTNAASAGANNDITSLSGLLTPFAPSVGGSSVFIGGTSGGTANAQTVAVTTPSGFALTQGWTVIFKAGATNTLATQLNVNAQGLTNVYKATASGPAALTGGEIVSGQLVIATYDGTEFLITPFPLAGWGLLSGSGGLQLSTTNPPLGADACSNLSISATVTSSVLTLTFNGNNGSTPSAINPILCAFRDSTIANGGPVWVSTASAQSITTNAAGATLGSVSSTPFRFWIVLFNNAGTIVPAIINASTATPTSQVFSLDEATPQSTTGISAAATSAGVFYTPNGTALSSKSFRIVGYLEYSSGLGTAGTYASVPTKVQLFGPGIKKPGDVVQRVYQNYGTYGSGANNYTPSTTLPTTSNTNLVASQAITPTSTANLLRVRTRMTLEPSGSAGTGVYMTVALMQDAGANAIAAVAFAGFGQFSTPGMVDYFNVANTASSTTFKIYAAANAGTTYWNSIPGGSPSQVFTTTTASSFIEIEEIMG